MVIFHLIQQKFKKTLLLNLTFLKMKKSIKIKLTWCFNNILYLLNQEVVCLFCPDILCHKNEQYT